MKALRTCFGMAPATTLLLLLTTVIAVAWFLPVDYVDDDMAYLCVVTAVDYPCDYMECDGPLIDSIGDALLSCCRHYIYVYGRFADKLVILCSLIPLWLANSLCGLSVGIMACLILACGKSLRHILPSAAGILFMWLMLPWYDLHSERAFIINYVFSTCFMLAFICLYSSGKGGFPAYATAFIAGMSHEIFGFGTLVWIAADALCRRNLSGLRLRLALTVAAAYLLMMCSPGTWHRFLSETASLAPDGSSSTPYLTLLRLRLSRIAVAVAPMALSCIAAVWALMCRRLSPRSLLPWLAVAACSFGIAFLFLSGGRLLWMGNIAAIVMLLRISSTFRLRLKLPASLRAAALALASALYCLWGWSLSQAQLSVSDTHRSINRQLASGSGPVAEASFPDCRLLPWHVAAMVTPIEGHYHNATHIRGKFYGYGDSVVYAPEGCAGLPLERWPRLPGANNIYGVSGCYYTPVRCGQPALSVSFGEYMPSASPFDRLFGLLRRDSGGKGRHTHNTLNYYFPSGSICGEPVYAVYLGEMPRGLDSRRILRVDTIR